MTRKNKRSDKDFKLEATKLVVEHGDSCAEASRRLGIAHHLVGSWIKAFRKSGELPAVDETTPVADNLKALRSCQRPRALRSPSQRYRPPPFHRGCH